MKFGIPEEKIIKMTIPNIKELTSITDYWRPEPTINTIYFSVPSNPVHFWSSTTRNDWTDGALTVYYSTGATSSGTKSTSSDNVRCVRNY